MATMSSILNIDLFHLNETANAIFCTKTNELLLDNFVMDFRGFMAIKFEPKQIAKLTKFIEFNQFAVTVVHHSKFSKYSFYLFTSKIKYAFLLIDGCDVESILKLIPNLKTFCLYYSRLPEHLPELNREFATKLSMIPISTFECPDYSLLEEFLQKQNLNVWITLCTNLESNVDDLH